MLDFPCRCGHRFSVPDDQSGLMVQCPKCGLLCDIPTLDDLRNLKEDGTYEIGKVIEPTVPADERFIEQTRAFTRETTDETGEVIDNREKYGISEEEPIQLVDEAPRFVAPRYDPVTGEMIRDVEVDKGPVETPSMPRGPLNRRPRRHEVFEPMAQVEIFGIMGKMLNWINLVVMGIVFLMHIGYSFCHFVGFNAGMLMVLVGTLFMFIAIVSHYANVIDETGPSCRDELPRPLRDFRFYEDLWQPFTQVLGSLVLCFGPGFMWLQYMVPVNLVAAWIGCLAFWGVGFVFLPAVLLTMTTSGSFINLRPDKLCGVMWQCGALYLWMIFVVAFSFVIYAYSWLYVTAALFAPLFGKGKISTFPWPLRIYITGPMLIFAIFCAHYTAWLLGQVYRVHQPFFPWDFQGRRSDGAPVFAPRARGFEVKMHPKTGGKPQPQQIPAEKSAPPAH